MKRFSDRIKEYLQDPFLESLWSQIKQAGHLKAVSVDLTHVCNLRCTGCYYFAEEMDRFQAPRDDKVVAAFIEQEKSRGTNFVTVLGGEPSLELDRLRMLAAEFKVMVVTNGLIKIPPAGLEDVAIGISVWGDHATDRFLRGQDRIDVFERALRNYENDRRAVWYYTTTPGKAHEIEQVVKQCVDNGNYVGFNYYGDLGDVSGDYDHRLGFREVQREIDRMIELYPQQILFSSYLNKVISTGKLYGRSWGFDHCSSITFDHAGNRARVRNGNPYNPHFRAYYADLRTTRRCCVGEARDCATCFDVWAHMSWIMLHLDDHLGSKAEFTNWLTSMYLFYLANQLVDLDTGRQLLKELHERVRDALAATEEVLSWRDPR